MADLAGKTCVPCRGGKTALAFVNKVGEVAESQGHHPDILLGWGKAEITTWTRH